MGTFSATAIHNAGARDPKKPRTLIVGGERRAERYPSGVTERFVDLQGNVVQCQLLPSGIARDQDMINRARGQLHRTKNGDGSIKGFVEHDKCPIKHGAHMRTPEAEEEFSAMPDELKRPCQHNPDTRKIARRGAQRVLEVSDPCPHIKWLIESRIKHEEERRNSRRTRQVSALDLEKQKLDIAKQQLDEQRKANEKMVAVVEASAGKGRKAQTE